jgi:hypothetical protein
MRICPMLMFRFCSGRHGWSTSQIRFSPSPIPDRNRSGFAARTAKASTKSCRFLSTPATSSTTVIAGAQPTIVIQSCIHVMARRRGRSAFGGPANRPSSLMRNALEIVHLPIQAVTPSPHAARSHNRKQRRKLEALLRRFGQAVPIIVDPDHVIIRWPCGARRTVRLGL